MEVLTHKINKTDDGSISFPHLQCWNPVTKVATIAAEVGGRRVSCRIKIDDLRKKFHTFTDEPMQSVTNYRVEIENAARKLIDKMDYEDDGSIMINYTDL
ncbi:MAG: DUF1488 family protein [Gammaproteobacteria bacterium]